MKNSEGFVGFLFLFALILFMLFFLLYACKTMLWCDEDNEENIDEELYKDFSEKFYKEAGRSIKHDVEIVAKNKV